MLADEDNPDSVIGAFESLPQQLLVLDRLPEAFRTGIGLSYDDSGPEIALAKERTLGPWHRSMLVSMALPKIDRLVSRLETGAKVADVGCGAGVALITMAKAFPRSEFHGYDNSLHALSRAEENSRSAGVLNAVFHNADAEPLPADAGFDFITTFDCLHDMAHPEQAMSAIRSAIKRDGIWFIADINCAPTLEENLTNPLASIMYGFSVLTCMSSGLSESGGLGLGTLGLPEPVLRDMVMSAGFRRFKPIDGLEHPFNAYYEARPLDH